jgi:hypothetical protein
MEQFSHLRYLPLPDPVSINEEDPVDYQTIMYLIDAWMMHYSKKKTLKAAKECRNWHNGSLSFN